MHYNNNSGIASRNHGGYHINRKNMRQTASGWLDGNLDNGQLWHTSIIQGSAIGPASYVVNGSDLQAVFEGNFLLKYADDTYLIIPAVNVDSRSTELSHITNWAKHNNLNLNLAKSQEIIFVDRKRKEKVSEPIEISQLQWVKVIKIGWAKFTVPPNTL